jgi:two-component system sensor histidine kinase KdpD
VLGTVALVLVLRATADYHGLPTQSMLLMGLVVAVALVGGLLPAVAAALLAGLGMNFYFVPPYGTLAVADPANELAIGVFLVTGVAVATVVDRAARTTHQAQAARREADALAELARKLLEAGGSEAHLLEQARTTLGMASVAVVGTADHHGITVEEVAGAPLDRLQPNDHRVTVAPGVDLVLRGRAVTAADQPLLTAYAAHLAVLRERERAAADARHTAELAEANRTRTALLAAVSHDLRSPIAAVKAAVSSLRSSDVQWSPEDEAELLAAVEDGADRLEGLVANLLDLSRLQMGVLNPLVTDVDLAAAVGWTLASLPDAERVVVRLDPDLPAVSADPGLLDRVLANVVENALQHAPAGTEIAIESRRDDDHVCLQVVDHGPGVPPAQRAGLFTPFQRLGDVPAGGGLGLGLAAARGLAETMDASLSAADTPGGGLTMTLRLRAAGGLRATR